MNSIEYHPTFFTATIVRWIHLLKYDKYKNILIESMKFLVEDGRVKIYGFVIMPNHIHIIWKVTNGHNQSDVQRDFLKYTSQKIKYDLKENFPAFLENFKSNNKDRNYQFWQYKSLSIELFTEQVFVQKLNYIHANPIQEKWSLSKNIIDYPYSSAKFYFENDKTFSFLSHFREHD